MKQQIKYLGNSNTLKSTDDIFRITPAWVAAEGTAQTSQVMS